MPETYKVTVTARRRTSLENIVGGYSLDRIKSYNYTFLSYGMCWRLDLVLFVTEDGGPAQYTRNEDLIRFGC